MVTTPPKADEFEISIFGPGRGECILLHLGNNEWCVIDSCIARTSSVPVAVEYLRAFDNGALANVKLVVATHWHDDHIAGLASILESAPNAKFCCSMALRQEEFIELVQAAPETITGRSGVDEFASILRELDRRGQSAPVFAVENKKLLNLSGPERFFPIKLETLSPSNVTIKLALSEMARFLPKAGEAQRRIPNRTPNDTSVVLWVEAGYIRALLGADLEHAPGRPSEGWAAVLACHQDSVPAQLFKVPHHGSIDSDHSEVWQEMLDENPVAIVTPFAGGKVRLPKDSDLERLSARTSQLYCTIEGSGQPPKRDPAVERTLRRQIANRSVIEGRAGQVRVRWSTTIQTATPSLELFSGAYRVGTRAN